MNWNSLVETQNNELVLSDAGMAFLLEAQDNMPTDAELIPYLSELMEDAPEEISDLVIDYATIMGSMFVEAFQNVSVR